MHASNDAHIGLFSVPQMKNPWYEIVIGGWANSKSVIRKNKQDEHGFIVMSSNTRNILDPTRFIGFSVRFHNRTIDVTREDEEKPFITWSDTVNIANISYIGMHTGFGTNNILLTILKIYYFLISLSRANGRPKIKIPVAQLHHRVQ